MAANKINITLKKHAKQSRSIATVDAMIEAATYILTRHGPAGFTANKVAEKAGVNIASFYQYFPNKEALLFHIIKLNWEKQLARISPVLARPGPDNAKKLRDFIREFFMIEAAEADLRRAVRIASIELRETPEFQDLISKGTELTENFLREAVKDQAPEDINFNVNFIVLIVTSFAERTTDQQTSGSELIRQADLLSDMLIAQFRIR
jgi:AcrR family transcriptional regulator